jgi:PEP-CTERM motif
LWFWLLRVQVPSVTPSFRNTHTDIYALTLDLPELSYPMYKFLIRTGNPPTFDEWESSDIRSFQVPAGGIDLPVVYFNNQTAVPEPAMGALLGAGMCAMRLLRRRG